MEQLKTAQEIKDHYNHMFWDEKGNSTRCQIWCLVHYDKTTPGLSAPIGATIPPTLVTADSKLPLNRKYAPLVDIEIHFMVGGPKYISIQDLPLGHRNEAVGYYFERAIRDAGGNFEDPNSTTLRIEHAFKNQRQAGIYEVTKMGETYIIDKVTVKKGVESKQRMDSTNGRMKAIIKLFEAEVSKL